MQFFVLFSFFICLVALTDIDLKTPLCVDPVLSVRWGEALRLEEQRIRMEEAAVREEALQVHPTLPLTASFIT